MARKKKRGREARGTRETGAAGVHAVGLIVERDLGWIFREQPAHDYGVDAQIEISDEGSPTGRLIAVQIKSGTSYLSRRNKRGFVFRDKLSHLEYWQRHALPVIVVLCDPESGTSYWQAVEHENIREGKKTWSMTVPFDQVLGPDAEEALRELIEEDEYLQRLSLLGLHKPWMELAEGPGRLILEADEWINKSAGTGSLRLIAEDERGNARSERDWPFVMFPHWIHRELFPRLFPWAEFKVDDDHYYDNELNEYNLNSSPWDSETKSYWTDYEEFKRWREQLSPVRPYEVASGEVARFRLVLQVGDLGQAFLLLDSYLSSGVAPKQSGGEVSAGYGFGLKALARRYLASPESQRGTKPGRRKGRKAR